MKNLMFEKDKFNKYIFFLFIFVLIQNNLPTFAIEDVKIKELETTEKLQELNLTLLDIYTKILITSSSISKNIQLALHTGLRKNNILLLNKNQVNIQKKCIEIGKNQTKGKKDIIMPLNSFIFNLV